MPESRSRARKPTGRYQLEPQKKQRSKASPKWYGPVILIVMGIGVAVIVLNYMQLMPGTGGQANNWYLFGGLGLILLGFVGTMYWR
jgi:LPXTG-motif cell wall-anchored protein